MGDKPLDGQLEQIRLEARLLAIENILAGFIADINRQNGVTPAQFRTASEEICQALRQQLVAQGKPAISDLIAAEVEQAIAALLKKIADYSQIVLQSEEDPPPPRRTRGKIG